MRILIIILSSFAMALSAQEPGKRTCRILFLMAPEDAPQTLHLFDGSSSQEVELPRMNLSMVYQLAPGDISLRLLPGAAVKGVAIDPAAPGVKVAADLTDFYLLVASDPSNKIAPVRISVINAGQSVYRNGQMLFFNLSNQTVGGQLGSQKLSIAPNARSVVDAPASSRGDYPVDLAHHAPGETKLYPICETKWQHDPTKRTLLFIANEPGTRTPRVMGFSDRREPEKKP